jgi:hypothetical protein
MTLGNQDHDTLKLRSGQVVAWDNFDRHFQCVNYPKSLDKLID